MKTKSTTPAKFNFDKIACFTEQELAALSAKRLPFCYQIGSDILVGRYKIKKLNTDTWEVVVDLLQTHYFCSRKDAIFYCMALHLREYGIAAEIAAVDTTLARLESDARSYRVRYKQACDAKDPWAESHFSSRYTDTAYKIHQVKQQLQKVLSRTKYIQC